MAGELISFGIQKLWNLLSQECQRFQGVEDQVAELKRDLSLLSSFLKDADAKTHKSAVVKTCVEEIKEIICDAEDTIETFLLKQNLRKTSGIKMRIRRLACIIPDRRENSLDIAGIRTRISDVIEKMQKFGVQQMITDGGYMQPLRDRQRAMRQTFPTEDYESDFVGLEANVKELIGYLVEENNVQVVSVTGMGGLGKTTLARQIFNHEDVKRQFDGLAWVCVSQDCTQKNVWQKILVALKPKEEENKILQMTELTLQGELFRLLDTSKSLIVLDDIWNEGDWDLIKPIFPPTKGWKVLLTSRNESIAMRRNTTYINFKPKCLTTEDSWTLFQKIALPIRDASELEIDEEMEEMGKQMIKHCGGLPLAIKVLGGLLAAKYTLHDWKRLSENIGSHLVGGRTDFNDENNNSVNYVLSLSFEELPSYLKHCFLYLAHFPEDYNIELKKLYYYWAAEGIYESRHYDGETIQDVGEVYIEELVRRNMVISEREATSLRFGYCHLHDMMREVCLLKAKEEKLFKIVTHPACSSSVHSQTSNQSRRLVVHTSYQDSDELYTRFNGEREIKNSKLRSLLFIPVDEYAMFIMGSNFMELQLLRVLDLSGALFKGAKLPSDIGKLIHLKYLSLYQAKVNHLPSSIGNLKSLLYLNLYVAYVICHVPNVLKEMQELRYLHLPRFQHKKTKLELGGLLKLETLINFSTKHSRVTDLHLMTRLRSLSINIEGYHVEMLAPTLSKLRDLENLTMNALRNDEKRSVLDCVLLKKPKSRMDITRLPKVQHFPSHLTTIHLRLYYLEEDPMPILETLLHLKEIKMHYSCARRMVCSGSGFPKLRELELYELTEWEEWIVEEGSMPLLHTLIVLQCPKLKEIPDGLRFLYSLKDLTMYRKWKERLSEGGADHDKVKHIPSVSYW